MDKMKYKRSWLRGIPEPFRDMIAKDLHISKRHHAMERRRKHVQAKKPKLGSGGRFAAFQRRLESKGMSANEAGAVAADAGRKKYGDKKMAKLSAMGRRRAAKNDNDGDE